MFSEGSEITYNDVSAESEADFEAFLRGEQANIAIT